MPAEIREELLLLINKARNQINTFTSVWYPPDNRKLHEFIFTELPWKARGHKTYELTFKRADIHENIYIPNDVCIIPFTDEYLDAACSMMDISLSHTFDNPNAKIFFNNKEKYLTDWREKAKGNDCCIMLENGELAGMYILKGAEIDFIAIAIDKQCKGLGKLLLHHAREHIFNTSETEPYLYCLESNPNALQFYIREGMKITGYSGYAYFEAVTN